MKSFVFAYLALAATSSGQSASLPSEGCADSALLTAALAKLNQTNWRALDEPKLRAIWPNEIHGRECRDGECSVFTHDGRTTRNRRECGESFYFRGTLNNGTVVPGLNSMLINSAGRKP